MLVINRKTSSAVSFSRCSVPARPRHVTTFRRRAVSVRAQVAEGPEITDARNIPKELLMLQAISPNRFAVSVLNGTKYAVTRAGPNLSDAMFIADPMAMHAWMNQEWEVGLLTEWPESLSAMLGPDSLATTRSKEMHQQLRQIFGVALTDIELKRMLPGIQETVKSHMQRWAEEGSVKCFDATLEIVFDVIVNKIMQFNWSPQEIKKYSDMFEVWNQGFTPRADRSSPDTPFMKAMAARGPLVQRFRQSLNDPNLTPGSIPAKLRDTYGANSDVCSENILMFIFAGFEGVTSGCTNLLSNLYKNPEEMKKLRKEHAEIFKKHGTAITLESLADMQYTRAAVRETLRLGQMVANVPRVAIKDIPGGNGLPAIPYKCPVSWAWGGMSVLDPAVKNDVQNFRPARWLEEKNKASLEEHQHPFGYGQHDCLGQRVAMATMMTMGAILARRYNLQADTNTEPWDFPTGSRPKNGLPIKLTPLPKPSK